MIVGFATKQLPNDQYVASLLNALSQIIQMS